MRVAIVSREFPPFVYGGAGVHVDHLVHQLQKLIDVDVYCTGEDRPGATCVAEVDARMPNANAALQVMSADLVLADKIGQARPDVVHSHTWYANFAGEVASLLHGIPHVISAHSLEPKRPWKAEQLGGGYALSSRVERAAYEAAHAIIAVSEGMRHDVLESYPAVDPARVKVIYNGIDTDFYRADPDTALVEALGVDPSRPSVAFVGRITRQKGVPHLLRAARRLRPEAQLVLLAGTADTPELRAETDALVAELTATRTGVVLVNEMQTREVARQVLSQATVFACPSVYEPLGIVNLEAMACETAVVASAVGGIPEVVVDEETGLLVEYTPDDPDGFEADLAEKINSLLDDPARAAEMGRAGRARAVKRFGWDAIARQTVTLYESVSR